MIIYIAGIGYASSSNDNSDDPQRQAAQLKLDRLSVEIDNNCPSLQRYKPQVYKVIAATSVCLEVVIDSLPFISACLSDQSSGFALTSFGQNLTYEVIYAIMLTTHLRVCFSVRPTSYPSKLLKAICLTNIISGSISTACSWKYYATSNSNYRLVNMVLNGVAGTVTFPLKMRAKRGFFSTYWNN